MISENHFYFMKQAIEQAKMASEQGEVPVGAIIVHNNKIIGRGYNLTQRLCDATAHAEMQAITAASEAVGGKYLTNCTLYVTLEPCIMCAGALFWSRITNVYYGTGDNKHGFTQHKINLHPKTKIYKGFLEEQCLYLLQDFFKNKR